MNLLFWITVALIVTGFIVLISMKKSMGARVALLIENESVINGEQISPKPVIWWIIGAVLWGIISIFLVIWIFYAYM